MNLQVVSFQRCGCMINLLQYSTIQLQLIVLIGYLGYFCWIQEQVELKETRSRNRTCSHVGDSLYTNLEKARQCFQTGPGTLTHILKIIRLSSIVCIIVGNYLLTVLPIFNSGDLFSRLPCIFLSVLQVLISLRPFQLSLTISSRP